MTKCVEHRGRPKCCSKCLCPFCVRRCFIRVRAAGKVHKHSRVTLGCHQLRTLYSGQMCSKLYNFFKLRICSKTSVAVGGFLFKCGLLIFAPSSSWLFRLVFEQLNINSNRPPFGNYQLLSDFKSTAFICTNKEQNVMIHSLLSLFSFLDTFWVISRTPPSLYAHMAINTCCGRGYLTGRLFLRIYRNNPT